MTEKEAKQKIEELMKKGNGKSAEEIIGLVYDEFKDRVIFSSALGEEDQVITDMISRIAPKMRVFTLDTGRLYQETYDLLAKTQKKYPMDIEIFYPKTEAVEEMTRTKGINLFYESVENRKLCCGIRKVEPLQRALKDVDAWMTGIRRGQSITRAQTETFEWDDQNKKIKVNPLAYWSLDDVHAYIDKHGVETNPLHKKGFVSIGCAPCTRAVKPGEDIRAGRWWWEEPQQKECGLHQRNKEAKK